jgi:high-affinity nickel-transport protein
MSRFFLRRVGQIDRSWKMYPSGSSSARLRHRHRDRAACTCGRRRDAQRPFLAIVSLPIIFAAGMSLMDTADGGRPGHAYSWAFSNGPQGLLQHHGYGLSVTVALVIGTIELLQVAAATLSLDGPFWTSSTSSTSGGSATSSSRCSSRRGRSHSSWEARRIEERWGRMVEVS